MGLASTLLRWAGWTVDITVPDYPKCIICVAPHTSNWDFVLGKLAYASVGRQAGFLMKSSWFFFPLGCIFRAMGGIPVHRDGNRSVTGQVVKKFEDSKRLTIAITPEGTRRRTTHWHTGFLHIARMSDAKIVLGAIDAATKTIIIKETFEPTGNIDADIRAIKLYYRPFKGVKPEKFTTE